MPTCRNCGKEWSWKQSFKKMFTLDTAMECPYCDRKQYLTTKARKRNSLLPFLAPLIMLLSILFDIPPSITLGMLLVTFLFIMGFSPLLMELSNEEEPLW
ncbi:TIGR04104 family putative zinc finger protein [Oceanobacillus halotolerans]|uniref:TIGR04104 family putative zinc finger protein n=1 Tax=Oceanobacillus halotolerans TaxID=2663380 RepID=UPI0013D990B4|nr:TIGR04104 family putative zinc finger protein [Oceanobacillus halotolerans]